MEKLQIQNMVKNHRLTQSVCDASWDKFVQKLSYKTKVVHTPSKNTTTQCSNCGIIIPKGLTIRINKCDLCGMVLDRDHNASINILQNGLLQEKPVSSVLNFSKNSKLDPIPLEPRELTLVEISRSVKQEEATRLVSW